ncbi:hypothetical protein ABZW03_40045 [Kitasatospora sp. NPDC004799]|uniref:hypothetical protein n=1 Tax=Kitasatospora sp. NPDC004799 TaxID=3154460 RepID=UPI0033AD56EB
MARTLPPLITEAAALSAAGAGVRRYTMGRTLIGAGADATVVLIEPGGDPVGGVQNSVKVLLRGEDVPEGLPRFDFRDSPPIRLFARLERGCLPLGAASTGGRPWERPASTTPSWSSTGR